MTATFLQSELTSLIADSKKKFVDVRSAAEKSSSDLKAISVTSEAQLAGDLSRRVQFIDPFILACQSKNPKLANSATACLQRLVASRAVPSTRLEDVLNAFGEVVNVGYDVQLKILQTLPALLQLYHPQIHGQPLARIVEICANLQASRTGLVSSSAGATLWQLIASVFEQARLEARTNKQSKTEATDEHEDGQLPTSTFADDAGRLLEDFCSMLNQTPPTFVHTDRLPTAFLVETIEKIVDGSAPYIKNKPYLVESCRSQLIPALDTLLHTTDDFQIFVGALRTSCIAIVKLAPLLFAPMRPVLQTILQFVDRDSGPLWKRTLCLEYFAKLCSNFSLFARIFEECGKGENLPVDLLAAFVRVAAEDPSLIGLGRQSTVPVQRGAENKEDTMASLDVQGIGGGLTSVTSVDASVTGISLDFSTLDRPLLDSADSSRVAGLPKTYIYTLILECIFAVCEGLSKFIMPLSVSKAQPEDETNGGEEGEESTAEARLAKKSARNMPPHKYQRLSNPLKMTELPQLPQVRVCADLIDACWPAILATCSTFLNAALDSHFYHVLIRSIQKLAQVSGTLELGTPRDALLTSLAKGSVPPNAAAVISSSQPATTAEEATTGQDVFSVKSPTQELPAMSLDVRKHNLNVRHLLCLRALLNLGIALGPTLVRDSWFIVIETLQQVEALMSISASLGFSNSKMDTPQGGQSTLTGEIAAVQTATRRLLESTRPYSDEAFAAFTRALLRLMGEPSATANGIQSPIVASPIDLASPTVHKRGHRASRSVSGLWTKTKALDVEVSFVFSKIKDLSRLNLHRFCDLRSRPCTWDLIVSGLVSCINNPEFSDDLRLQAASIVNVISLDIMKMLDPSNQDTAELDSLQCLALQALVAHVHPKSQAQNINATITLQIQFQKRVLETLEEILGNCGDSLQRGWKVVFQILEAVFEGRQSISDSDDNQETSHASVSAAFRCIQLICNDFLQNLENEYLGHLIKLLRHFGSQKEDVNMALTTSSLLRTLTTILQDNLDILEVSQRGFGEDASRNASDILQPSYLWCLAMNQLRDMCLDSRRDVRDASIRILLQALEGASGKLTGQSWNIVLAAIPFSILREYRSTDAPADPRVRSLTMSQLIQGMTELMIRNIDSIVESERFSENWSEFLALLDAVLVSSTPEIEALVLGCTCDLLEALKPLNVRHSVLVRPALVLWAAHPVGSGADAESTSSVANQEAVAARMRLLNRAYATSPGGVKGLSYNGENSPDLVCNAIKRTLLETTHPLYSNDVRKPSLEQEEALQSIQILKELIPAPDSAEFLISLVKQMLCIQGDKISRSPRTLSSKRMQWPTYIATSTTCIKILCEVIEAQTESTTSGPKFPAASALRLLSAIINTKYTSVPLNPEEPLWRTATAATVTILETTAGKISGTVSDLAVSISAVLSAILGSGGLEGEGSQSSPDTLVSDEDFDITQFWRFHAAAIRLLADPNCAQEQRQEYLTALFDASLVSKPWLGDFGGTDTRLATNPLKNLNEVRPGSVHDSAFTKRMMVAYAALDALFQLLDPDKEGFHRGLGIGATPYVILRAVHPMKVFMADQPLRGLSPLPMPLQIELSTVLSHCLELNSDGVAIASALDIDTDGAAVSGKAHLHVLFNMILRFQRAWRGTIRLSSKRGYDIELGLLPWQDEKVGQEIERGVEQWIESVGRGPNIGATRRGEGGFNGN